ncbi:MAG: choice-of-anchor Q domain-containing protein [Pyrinomonadaceae bacterium]
MKVLVLTLVLFPFLFPSAWTVINVKAQGGALFTVNHAGDTNDANVGDGVCADSTGKCTLRAAIQEANNDNYLDGINFALPLLSTIELTLGELNVASKTRVVGPGARNLTIQRSTAAATPNFRVFNLDEDIVLRGLTIKNGNVPDGDGGGIRVRPGSIVTLSDIVVTGNSANRGGGIFNSGGLTLRRSLVNANTAVTNGDINGSGGGLFNDEPFGSADVVNSTMTENTAIAGGSIYNRGRGLFLINATISHNNAVNFGCSVVNAANGTATFLNTIVGMDNSLTISSLSGAFNSLGNNLITDARNSTGFAHGVNNDQVSNNNAINPLLGNLIDNGGQTDTRALLDGSPAINTGNNCVYYGNCPQPIPPDYYLTSDQRINRLRLGGNAVDVGAYEYQTFAVSGSFTFGVFTTSNRSGGTLVILTKASTNEKRARITNPFGNFSFNDLAFGEVYFLERKPKRIGQLTGLGVFAFDGPPPGPQTAFTLERDGMKIIVEK